MITTAVGINMIAFGVHQMARPQEWRAYVPQPLDEALPLGRDGKLRVHGFGNFSLGMLFLGQRKLKLTAPLVTAWWAFVLPLCGRKDWRAGARDISILGALLAIVTVIYGKQDALRK
jgi:hypothetical protein